MHFFNSQRDKNLLAIIDSELYNRTIKYAIQSGKVKTAGEYAVALLLVLEALPNTEDEVQVNLEADYLSSAFVFAATPQDYHFWAAIAMLDVEDEGFND